MPKSTARLVHQSPTLTAAGRQSRKQRPATGRSQGSKTPPPDVVSPRRRRSAEEQLVGFPLQRVFDVHTWINDGKMITKASLAEEWDVATCTVKRALQFMRTRLEMPIEWDDLRKTYYYTRPFPTLPFLILSRREAVAMALAVRVCGGMFGATFGRLLDGILRKITPALGSAVSRALKSVEHVHAPQALTEVDEFEVLMPILEAIEARRVLEFEYAKPDTSTPKQRLVHPLDLGYLNGGLRLIAYDPARGHVRDFRLTRIRDLKPRDEIFERPKDFDAAKRLKDSAGAHAGDPVQEVRLALDALAAAYAREQAWHHSQKLRPLPDGRTELTLRTSDLPGIRNRVLSWGLHAEVLAPPALREEVRAALKAALEQYSDPM